MNRDAALAALLAVLALLALGVAAATLDDPVAADGFGSGSGGGQGSGVATPAKDGDSDGSSPLPSQPRLQGQLHPLCLEWLKTPRAMAALFLLVFLPSAAVAYRARWLLPGAAFFVSAGGPLFLVWLALTACDPGAFRFGLPSRFSGMSFGGAAGNGGGGGGSAVDAVASQPSVLLGVLLVAAIAVAVLLLFVSTGDADEVATPPEEALPPAEPDVAAVGRAAGRAADRLSNAAGVDNEVYRAWAEMTDHLAVAHPESSTPAEFAEAAVAAGMAPDDVRELTDLFEAVRYGGRPATGADEQRAIAALRRIEAGYASDGN